MAANGAHADGRVWDCSILGENGVAWRDSARAAFDRRRSQADIDRSAVVAGRPIAEVSRMKRDAV